MVAGTPLAAEIFLDQPSILEFQDIGNRSTGTVKLAQHVDFEICALTGSAPGRNDRTVRQKQPCRLAALAAGVFPSNHSLTQHG